MPGWTSLRGGDQSSRDEIERGGGASPAIGSTRPWPSSFVRLDSACRPTVWGSILRDSAAPGLATALRDAIRAAQVDIADASPPTDVDGPVDEVTEALKFAESVPQSLLARLSRVRFHPAAEVLVMRDRPVEVRFAG